MCLLITKLTYKLLHVQRFCYSQIQVSPFSPFPSPGETTWTCSRCIMSLTVCLVLEGSCDSRYCKPITLTATLPSNAVIGRHRIFWQSLSQYVVRRSERMNWVSFILNSTCTCVSKLTCNFFIMNRSKLLRRTTSSLLNPYIVNAPLTHWKHESGSLEYKIIAQVLEGKFREIHLCTPCVVVVDDGVV